MRRKFQISNFKFQIFLLAAAVALFVAPATASAAPSATISGPNWSWWNQNLTYTAQVYGGSSGSIFITRQDNASFTCPSGIVTDSQGRRWCVLKTFTYSSTGTGYFTPRELGTYVAVANGYSNSTAGFTADRNTECTGNPFTYNTNQWSDCGGSDNIFFTVYAPAPTPTARVSSSCTSTDTSNLVTISWPSTSPAISYVDISSNNFSGWNYKYVAGSTSTTASIGFGSAYNVSGPLQFIPGTQYAARLWNGSAHSNWAWFQAPAACPPPSGSLSLTSGSQNVTVGSTNGFRADLTNAGSGQIWITKGDGKSPFPCPNMASDSPTPFPNSYLASTGRYWCRLGQGSGSSVTGSFNFTQPDTYTAVINAYTKSNQTGTGPRDECTGTPSSLGFDGNKWSDCGSSDNITITARLPAPTCNEAHPSAATTNATSGSFRVYATGVQNATEVNFPTWSEENGQDDIIWYRGTNSGGGTWFADIDLARHPGLGWIRTHTYMYNSSYTNQWCDSADFQRILPNCNTNPDCNLCPAPANTCYANNGTTTCYYRGYTGGGICQVVSFTQSCTINKCYPGTTCASGSCVGPPPTPSISAAPVCTPTDNRSMYTVSWPSTSPAISYVDISSNNFASWSNKYVAGSTSTSVSSGFSNGFTLQPNTTYYVRTWNGSYHSSTITFTTPVSCTCDTLNNAYNYIDSPADPTPGSGPITYTIGTSYPIVGWSTFCSGPNGTNRDRVDPYICNSDGSNCRYIGPTSSSVRQDVVNASWTCGNLNSNSDGWTFNWTPPDSSFLGTKNLSIASINDHAANCVLWRTKTVNINPVPPTATVTGTGTTIVGNTITYSATLSGGARGGQIHITKGDGRLPFPCPNMPDFPNARQVSTGLFWCQIGEGTGAGATITGRYNFSEADTYTIAVNAFVGTDSNYYKIFDNNPAYQCTGTPDNLATNITWNTWARCGAGSSTTTRVSPPPPAAAPIITQNTACVAGGYAGNEATISWTNPAVAVSYVDISDRSDFSVFWNKYVGGSSSTNLSGFGTNGGYWNGSSWVSQSLTLQPGTKYYVRLWNGSLSPTSSFFIVSCNCGGNTIIDNPTDPLPATYVVDTSYTINGWGTFCSGPNGTNRDRVDLHVCDQGTSNCRYIGRASAYPRPDVVNDASTCGSLNPNADGWTFNWTPDSSFLGEKDLFVASINDSRTTCHIGASKQINIISSPPTASLSSPANNSSTTIGQSVAVSATATGTNLTKVNIYRALATSDLTKAASWTRIAEQTTQTTPSCSGSSCSLTASWTPAATETGQWVISVNAYDGYNQQCSGMHTTPHAPDGYWTADCDRNGSVSNVTVNVTLPIPQATITGPRTATAGDTPIFTATLSGGAENGSGQIWVTKGNGLSSFNCTTQMIQASKTKRWWCLAGAGTATETDKSVTGRYTFPEAGDYTMTVNAYNNVVPEGTSPANRCTGTPNALATDKQGNDVTWSDWSRCSSANNTNPPAYIQVTVSPPLTTTNCGGGVNPRAEGLVTTPSLIGQFGTSPEGRCIKDDPRTIFTSFKIPTYDELKSLYYTQSKASKELRTDSVLSFTQTEDGKVFNYTASEVNIDNPFRYDKTAVIFIEGNLNINKDIITNPATPAKGLVLVVKNNVNIDKDVNQIDAIIISSGNIYTAGAACATSSVNVGAPPNALTINGSLISLSPGKIVFCRTLNDNRQAAEKINNQPKYLVILSNLFANTLQKWSDITAGGSAVPANCSSFNGSPEVCISKGCSYDNQLSECQ